MRRLVLLVLVACLVATVGVLAGAMDFEDEQTELRDAETAAQPAVAVSDAAMRAWHEEPGLATRLGEADIFRPPIG